MTTRCISSYPYPKPGPEGGRIIREVIAFLRDNGCSLPITSHILIATSGGTDSVALAHLLVNFGRKVAPKDHIKLLHVNHGWRGTESDQDEAFVRELGGQWKVPVIVRRLKPPSKETYSGQSWEDEARKARKAVFSREAKRLDALVITAHQADDLAETLLWRLFTGAAKTHGGGIAFQHGVEIRPLLKMRKSRIKEYLREVGQTYREDSTNVSDRFLRARMRQGLIPELEKLFPRATEHLVTLALKAQRQAKFSDKSLDLPLDLDDHFGRSPLPHEILFQAAGLKARRPHLEIIAEKCFAKKGWYGEVHLPGGWKLSREKRKGLKKKEMISEVESQGKPSSTSERWILERI